LWEYALKELKEDRKRKRAKAKSKSKPKRGASRSTRARRLSRTRTLPNGTLEATMNPTASTNGRSFALPLL